MKFFRRTDGDAAQVHGHGQVEDKDREIEELGSAMMAMSQDMEEKDRQIERLEAVIATMEQDMASAQGAGVPQQPSMVADLQAGGGDRDQLVQRAACAEAKAIQFQQACNDREVQVAELQEALANTEETLFKRAADAEGKVQEMQAILTEKDRISMELQAMLGDMEQELSRLQDEAARNAVSVDAEGKTTQLQVLTDLKDQQIARLEAVLQGMEEEITQLRGGAGGGEATLRQVVEERDQDISRLHNTMTNTASRVEAMEAEREALAQRAGLAEQEAGRLQGLLDMKDKQISQLLVSEKETSASRGRVVDAELQRLQVACGEKDQTILQLQAQMSARSMGGDQEKQALAMQANEAQVKIAQITKSFEEERAKLRNRLTEQFEAEYAAIRSQVTQSEREAQKCREERDAVARRMEQTITEYEQKLRLIGAEARQAFDSMPQPATRTFKDGQLNQLNGANKSLASTGPALAASLAEACAPPRHGDRPAAGPARERAAAGQDPGPGGVPQTGYGGVHSADRRCGASHGLPCLAAARDAHGPLPLWRRPAADAAGGAAVAQVSPLRGSVHIPARTGSAVISPLRSFTAPGPALMQQMPAQPMPAAASYMVRAQQMAASPVALARGLAAAAAAGRGGAAARGRFGGKAAAGLTSEAYLLWGRPLAAGDDAERGRNADAAGCLPHEFVGIPGDAACGLAHELRGAHAASDLADGFRPPAPALAHRRVHAHAPAARGGCSGHWQPVASFRRLPGRPRAGRVREPAAGGPPCRGQHVHGIGLQDRGRRGPGPAPGAWGEGRAGAQLGEGGGRPGGGGVER
eukprot:CAMPEP_0168396656 /NCGR_PEP_ID=MMETSP0228-20121227/20663_1 /TAXON_ID=133427 /ORGANISM="Protoceratium reticulatum, Strain CCCM 535 (=CCMP 1889)" /LENGTH=811 /DNA_ID=CAMNT_0008410109 /DNA_START=50 /DNA_END=2482 /DNA_ORIENTATION=+